MKTILSFVTILFIALTVNAQEIQFDEETIDYGKIAPGSEGKRVFKFTNVGDEPLIIESVQSTCGCTVPKKPEKPIMPGEKGEIEVSYDTKRKGGFSKAITIISNAKRSVEPKKLAEMNKVKKLAKKLAKKASTSRESGRTVLKIKGFVDNKIVPAKAKSMVSDEK
ncbi:DUF1573 domain-containing protein [Tenacibaculum sp. C7A-26P2]|uniref:DUF1573 domain-containing protein n=1 Tax=Tenacibaculum sp. C7A-26P2 TaxID=3447504 RepID=UPI003F85B027